MFFETHRLARETLSEAVIMTETVTTPCVKCAKPIRVTAKEDVLVKVKCPHCKHEFELIIESMKKSA